MSAPENPDGFLEWHGISAESAALIRGLCLLDKAMDSGKIEVCRNCGFALARCNCKPIPLEDAWQNWRPE